MRWLVVAFVLHAAGPARADADGLTDTLGPREVAMGDAMRAAATSAAAASLNPSSLGLTNELVFEGGYGYRAIDQASVVNLAACDSTNAAPGCFYYNYFTATPDVGGMELSRTAHTAGLTLSRVLSPRIMVGAGAKYYRYDSTMPDEADARGMNWDLGATMRLTDIVNLGVVGYNLKTIFGDESAQFPRAIGAGATIKPAQQLSASFDALWNLDTDGSTGRYGGGAEYFILTRQGQVGYPLRGGAVHDVGTDATYVTAGAGITTMKMSIDVGGRQQVSGGDERLIIASLRLFIDRNQARR
jgi:hypothetical protein